jgi:hypothetical protein
MEELIYKDEWEPFLFSDIVTYFLIIWIVLYLVSFFLIEAEHPEDWEFKGFFVRPIVTLFFTSLIMSFVYSEKTKGSDIVYDYKKELIVKQPLLSLKTIGSIDGEFVLGFGTINSSEKYSAYIKKHGGFQKYYIPGKSIIKEEERVDGLYIKECYFTYRHKKSELIDKKISKSKDRNDVCSYTLFVPNGTVHLNFSAQ